MSDLSTDKNCPGWTKHEYQWFRFCGAWVCVQCGHHKGLARCYCGWGLAPGERLEDDIGDARFIGGAWEVDY